MMWAECFFACYIDLWAIEFMMEMYQAGILKGVPQIGVWTLIMAALGASACLLAYVIGQKQFAPDSRRDKKY